ncbi:hypothetical protein E3N88_06870 [Mikania micrantha]|uniref:UDP-glycosyltransferases domain-containing protein n=1 Tax=Mikania micrantha TaxID=192012 RepID=A0A5N6PPW6_9ASTR|nr:hypothetical protein E3N88_06870 [Mikania micrantha]
MKKTHVLLIPYPAQGHVTPLMEAAQCLTSNGLKVTFVNTDFTHKRVSACSEIHGLSDMMQMVSIPDGMEACDDRSDLGSSAAVLAVIMSLQKLMDDEVINCNGIPLKDQKIQLSTTMPFMNPTHFIWACIGDSVTAQLLFDFAIIDGKEAAEAADHIICNSTMDLEPGAFTLFPKMLPIGPLLATIKSTRQVGHFWNEDSTCLTWLDHQPVRSVIYVAFGSFTIFDQTQFEELALGLELTQNPFLWVVRPGTSDNIDYVYPSGYIERIGNRGKMVSWAPQQEVLNHPSLACFMSHCGWNSTMEGVSNGVPFLCWPYFADQFFNKTYICDIWKNGVSLNKDDTGIVRREEIKSKRKCLEFAGKSDGLRETWKFFQQKSKEIC